ncbi:MAG: glycosyltransferase family 4 protein [Candidatus Eremiobacteraeota bacterium]|nr:glycosyltransferase family 4 protein [Candidatus Eremiobacteraeota bacterium]
MKRLRVLSVVNTLYFGGAECRLLSLAKEMNSDRFDQTVLTLKRVDTERERRLGTLRPHFASANVAVESLDIDAPEVGSAHGSAAKCVRSVPRLSRTLIKLAAYIRANHIDLLDTHCGTANKVGIAAAILTRRPVIATTYGLEIFRPLWLWRLSESVLLTLATAIVTDSDAVAAQIRRQLLRPRRIAVIPNGIEPPKAYRKREEMHAQFGIPSDSRIRVVGQVASLTPRKGQLVLLDAAEQLVRTEPHVHFLICGYARDPLAYERALHARTADLGLTSRVHFVGYPGPIGDVYNAIDIQVHPSIEESLPQAIIEGMALGKPAVATAVAGIPTMVSDGATGIIVRPGDAQALAAGIRRLLRDTSLAARLGLAAQQRYWERYTDARMARSLEKLFEDVARPSAA